MNTRPPPASLRWLNRVAIWLFEAILFCASRRKVLGLLNVPLVGPAVVVSNHISMADALVLATTIGRSGRTPTFLGMVELFRWPIIGPLAARMGHVPVERNSSNAAAALRPALDVLRAGGVVALYPEGKVTTQPDYRPMPTAKSGAARLALTAQCSVVPVAQWGAHHLLTRDHASTITRRVRVFGWLRPGRAHRRPNITVLVGPPITYAELLAVARNADSDDLNYRAATALIMGRVSVLLAAAAPEDMADLSSPPRFEGVA